MQKRASPFFAVAFVTVFVFRSSAGTVDLRLMSTLTALVPAAIGNEMASKVSEPEPYGKSQVFEAEASPEQCNNVPMTPAIVRSKVAPATSSLSWPLPVIFVFCPRVTDGGVKPVILVLVLETPQSFQVKVMSFALVVAKMRAVMKAVAADFIL